MKKYIIDEEKLKELLYDHYELDCLYCNGVDNWIGYMDNKTRYINSAFGKTNSEDWDEDADFIDIVNVDLTEYIEAPESLAEAIYKIINSDNLDYIDNEIEKAKQEIKDKITKNGYFTYLSL